MKYSAVLLIIVSFFLGCLVSRYNGMTAEEWAAEAESCNIRLEGFRSALDDANENIFEAQLYAGSSYTEMDFALSNLFEVPAPYSY